MTSPYRTPGETNATDGKPPYPRLVILDGAKRLVQRAPEVFVIERLITDRDGLGGEVQRWAAMVKIDKPKIDELTGFGRSISDNGLLEHCMWLCEQLAKVTS